MSPALPALNDFSDRLSPMVVKEMRQGLRTHTFTVALIVFHLTLVALMFGMLTMPSFQKFTASFWLALGIIFVVILPLRGLNALSQETREGSLDLLWLTDVSPWRLVWGKWFSLFSQTLLLVSSLLPYMIARHRFGGVEVAAELLVLLMLVILSALSTAAIISLSWLPAIWLRLMMSAGIIWGALWIGKHGLQFVMQEYSSASYVTSLPPLSVYGWIMGLVSPLILISGLVLFCITLGAARLSWPGQNLTWFKRKLSVGVVLATLLTCAFEPLGWGAMLVPCLLGWILCVSGMDLTTESLPSHGSFLLIGRPPVTNAPARHLRYPGWPAGTWFYAVLCLMALGGSQILMMLHSSYSSSSYTGYVATDRQFWELVCLLEGPFVSICLSRYSQDRFLTWWYVQLGLHAIGLTLYLVATSTRTPELALIGFLTPVTAIYSGEVSGDMLPFVGSMWGLFWVVGALVLSWMEMPKYRLLEAEAHDAFPEPNLWRKINPA